MLVIYRAKISLFNTTHLAKFDVRVGQTFWGRERQQTTQPMVTVPEQDFRVQQDHADEFLGQDLECEDYLGLKLADTTSAVVPNCLIMQ